MKEYLFLFRGGERERNTASPEESQANLQRWAIWMGNLTKEGRFVGAQPLAGSGKQIKGSKKVVTDGPFIESKETIGGYLMCKAESYDEAVEIAKGCPILEFEEGTVEVREIQEMKM